MRGAGTSCGDIDSLVLQRMQEYFASYSGKGHTDDMGCCSLSVRGIRQKTVNFHMIQSLHAFNKSSLTGTKSRMILIKTTVQHFRCFGKSGNSRDIFCTGSKVLLLTATEYDRLDLHLISYI